MKYSKIKKRQGFILVSEENVIGEFKFPTLEEVYKPTIVGDKKLFPAIARYDNDKFHIEVKHTSQYGAFVATCTRKIGGGKFDAVGYSHKVCWNNLLKQVMAAKVI